MLGRLFEPLIDHWRALMRFPAARHAWSVVLSALLTIAARRLLGAPPIGFGNWPIEARYAASGIVEGAFDIAFAGFVAALATPAVWLRQRPLRLTAAAVAAVVTLGYGAQGVLEIIAGLSRLEGLPAPGVARVLSVAAYAIVAPMAVGSAPLVWFYAAEWLTLLPLYRRLFKTGVGPDGGWLPPHKMRRYLEPLPKVER